MVVSLEHQPLPFTSHARRTSKTVTFSSLDERARRREDLSSMDLDRWNSPPPQYSESNTASDSKNDDHWKQGHTPWLVQRTSIVVETSAATADSASSLRESTSPSRSTDQRNGIRGIFRRDDRQESLRSGSNSQRHAIHDGQLGTQVTIEANQPIRSTAERRIELKGLEQAASTRRWPGSARAPEPWGKLKAVCVLPASSQFLKD